jgi:hypothetical protein
MVATSLLSLLLLALAGVLLDSHRREWAAARGRQQDSEKGVGDYRFARRRVVRRSTATMAIAVVGVVIGLWPVTPREPLWVAAYLAALMTLCVMIFLLGVGDAWASGHHYRAEGRQRMAEQARALAKLIEAQRGASDEVSTDPEGRRR